MRYFPIFRNSNYIFLKDEILNYLKTFPDHRIYLNVIRSGEEEIFHFKTVHEYTCKLTFELLWTCHYQYAEFDSVLTHKVFLELLENLHTEILQSSIIRYSNPAIDENLPENVIENFWSTKRRIKKSLSPEEYYALEHNVLVQSTIPDSFFNELIREVDCYIQFESFLENKKNSSITE